MNLREKREETIEGSKKKNKRELSKSKKKKEPELVPAKNASKIPRADQKKREAI